MPFPLVKWIAIDICAGTSAAVPRTWGLISRIGGKPALRFVFDVADTSENEDALFPDLWQYLGENTAKTIDPLQRNRSMVINHRIYFFCRNRSPTILSC